MKANTILIDDAPDSCNDLPTSLRQLGYGVQVTQNSAEILACVRSPNNDIGLIILNLSANPDDLETLRQIRGLNETLPVIAMLEHGSCSFLTKAGEQAATACLTKPFSTNAIVSAVLGALSTETPRGPGSLGRPNMFTSSPRMQKIRETLRKVASSAAPVILRGESGVGKEVLAREMHACSPRAGKPFVKINCAALPSELLESELFGYERGAFTGAFKTTLGKFELADGGSLLLDEIGDMDLKLQAKLLHVLQDWEFYRLGGKKAVKIDVRVIAATHRNLQQQVRAGRFREDLYYRLCVVDVEIPPLRRRQEEILPLMNLFLQKHALPEQVIPDVTPDLERALLIHSWPGNVRELENVARRLLAFEDAGLVAEELTPAGHFKPSVLEDRPFVQPFFRSDAPVLEELDRAQRQTEAETILAALEKATWNRRRAAAVLQIDYKALLYKMKKLGINKNLRSSRPRLEDLATGLVV
jgi:DNA-binding NtrC family response regulator